MRTVDEITFESYRDFVCTVGSCVEYCCQPTLWDIDVDEHTYALYESMFDDGEVGKLLKKHVVKQNDHYVMTAAEDKNCPFLDQDHLCKLQKTYGENHLSFTCRQFPRLQNLYGRYLQTALSLACPLAAEMILNNPGGFKFVVHKNVRIDEGYLSFLSEAGTVSNLDAHTGLTIRDACADIVSISGVPFPVKAFYVCTMLNALKGNEGNAAIMRQFKDNAGNKAIVEEILKLRNEKANDKTFLYPLLLKVLKGLFVKTHIPHNINVDFYNRLYGNFLNPTEFNIAAVIRHKENVVDKFFNENEFIISNYLIHYMFVNRFPLEDTGLDTAGLKMFLEFILIQLFIACVYIDAEALDMRQVINCVYYFSRKRSSLSAAMFINDFINLRHDLDFSLLVTI